MIRSNPTKNSNGGQIVCTGQAWACLPCCDHSGRGPCLLTPDEQVVECESQSQRSQTVKPSSQPMGNRASPRSWSNRLALSSGRTWVYWRICCRITASNCSRLRSPRSSHSAPSCRHYIYMVIYGYIIVIYVYNAVLVAQRRSSCRHYIYGYIWLYNRLICI